MQPVHSKRRRICSWLAGLLLTPIPGAAASFTYELANHPDGNAAAPFYGLRLDELFDATSSHDIFTFDFDHADSNMRLVYDDGGTTSTGDDSIRIFGTVMGGLDTGSSYADGSYFGAWAVDFSYVDNFTSGGTDIEVGGMSADNAGTITPLFAVGGDRWSRRHPISLTDEQGSHSYSFRFNNVDDHRLGGYPLSGPDTFVGWGWMTHHDQPHVYSTDWLFTGSLVVPEPGTASLLMLGLVALATTRPQR